MTTTNRALGIILLVAIVLAIVVAVWSKNRTVSIVAPVACPQDAYLCPSGTYVSRVSPSCQFAACPVTPTTSTPEISPSSTIPVITPTSTASSVTTTPGWKIVTDIRQGIAYAYPEKLGTKYIRPQSWPPALAVEQTSTSKACTTTVRMVEDRSYCVHETSEGAAGSLYTTYVYTNIPPAGVKAVTLQFTLQFVQCLNYSNPEQSACLKERSAFKSDQLADSILQTVRFESDPSSEK